MNKRSSPAARFDKHSAKVNERGGSFYPEKHLQVSTKLNVAANPKINLCSQDCNFVRDVLRQV